MLLNSFGIRHAFYFYEILADTMISGSEAMDKSVDLSLSGSSVDSPTSKTWKTWLGARWETRAKNRELGAHDTLRLSDCAITSQSMNLVL